MRHRAAGSETPRLRCVECGREPYAGEHFLTVDDEVALYCPECAGQANMERFVRRLKSTLAAVGIGVALATTAGLILAVLGQEHIVRVALITVMLVFAVMAIGSMAVFVGSLTLWTGPLWFPL